MSDQDHSSAYSEGAFWDKVKRFAKKAGSGVLEPALKMYYSAQDTNTPAWAKATIIGALGYFISPIDAIPDITPFIGYTDDFGVLVGALAAVANHVTDEHKALATEKLKQWFS